MSAPTLQASTRDRLADRAAATLADQGMDRALWFGPTGTKVTGTQAAAYLTRAVELLQRDGWDPSTDGFGILEALNGPTDLTRVSGRCVDLILCSISGAPVADYSLWEIEPGRTFEEVRDLLLTGAVFAREHGSAVAA